MEFISDILQNGPVWVKTLLFLGLAVATHLLVMGVRFAAINIMSATRSRHRKARSLITLFSSALVFALYFLAVGFALQEMGISLTAYLASASVIGLAVGFGSQGVVQDVVMGLTFVFSDLLDVGDLVEISGQTGIVRGITMRFIELENALGARVFIPNRTINNVVNYPRGYIRCLADITLRGDEATREQAISIAQGLMQSTYEQFPGILLTQPSIEGRMQTHTGKDYLRIKFRLWPNRGQPIETTFAKELLAELRKLDPDYQDWMVAIYYEVEEKPPQQAARLKIL